MRAVAHRAALPDRVPYAAAEAAFAEAEAFLCSREARQMSESDLERELHRRGQELMRKLLQGHREQRSPREAAGPVEGADEEALEAHGDGGRRLRGRAVRAEPGGVPAEPEAPIAGREALGRAASPGGETGLCEPRTGPVGGGHRGDAGSRAPPRARQALGPARRWGRDAARPGGSERRCVRHGRHGGTRNHPRGGGDAACGNRRRLDAVDRRPLAPVGSSGRYEPAATSMRTGTSTKRASTRGTTPSDTLTG